MNGATPISSSIWPSTWLPSTTDNIQGAGGLYRPLTSSCKKGTIIRIVPFLFPGYARQHSGLISFPLAGELCRKEALFSVSPATLHIGKAHVCTPVTNAHLVC